MEMNNPTIGILLCSETDEDIARYSVLHDNERLFMSKYLTYLPTKEQLREEIEKQKAIFYTQHPNLQGETPWRAYIKTYNKPNVKYSRL